MVAKKKPAVSSALVTIDRRRSDRRKADPPREQPVAPKAKLERRVKVNRRRQIDPTTCERDYSVEEVEFMNALDQYKRQSGRMFPTCSEVLEVIRELGYVRLARSAQAATPVPATDERATDEATTAAR